MINDQASKSRNRIPECLLTLLVASLFLSCSQDQQPVRPNILLIIADDLNYDSPGFAGGVAPDVTPNIDRLAGESLSFEQAFSVVAVCQPSRQAMLCGLIPNHYGSKGFWPMAKGIPTLPALLKEAGYLTGNIHKLHHMLPEENFPWDFANETLGLTDPDGMVGRDPQAIGAAIQRFIDVADDQNKPFFMVASSADPHRPFHGDPMNKNIPFWGNGEVDIVVKEPSRIYTPDEVVVPPSLPDIAGVREDLAKYASSVRRLDDMVGECLKALRYKSKEQSTLVLFVSDNGMPLPFGKFDTYLGSNRSPLLMRWPERIKTPGTNSKHLVSLMDITPTVLELANIPIPAPMDGRSLTPFIDSSTPETWRESIVFIRNEDIYYGDALKNQIARNPEVVDLLKAKGWKPSPEHPVEGTYTRDKEIRTYYDGRYGYIFNDCYLPDGLEINELGVIVPYGDPTYRAMKKAAVRDRHVNGRYEFYLLRAQEELYDWSEDPGSQKNLATDPSYADVLTEARKGLMQYMESANDPLTTTYGAFIGGPITSTP